MWQIFEKPPHKVAPLLNQWLQFKGASVTCLGALRSNFIIIIIIIIIIIVIIINSPNSSTELKLLMVSRKVQMWFSDTHLEYRGLVHWCRNEGLRALRGCDSLTSSVWVVRRGCQEHWVSCVSNERIIEIMSTNIMEKLMNIEMKKYKLPL